MTSDGWTKTARGWVKRYGPAPVAVARSVLACPMIVRDGMDATQSMADGNVYTSKSALRRSYTAEGNPQGRDYTEIGTADIEPAGQQPVDKAAIREATGKALHDVLSGNVPEHIRAIT